MQVIDHVSHLASELGILLLPESEDSGWSGLKARLFREDYALKLVSIGCDTAHVNSFTILCPLVAGPNIFRSVRSVPSEVSAETGVRFLWPAWLQKLGLSDGGVMYLVQAASNSSRLSHLLLVFVNSPSVCLTSQSDPEWGSSMQALRQMPARQETIL